MQDGLKKIRESGADGVMFGRAIFGNPWLFKNLSSAKKAFDTNDMTLVPNYVPALKEKLTVMMEHTELYEKKLGDIKNFAIMKKHFKAYVNGFDGARELRAKLMETNTAAEVRAITEEFIQKL
jgi:tRNA-dihydrouridine synthase